MDSSGVAVTDQDFYQGSSDILNSSSKFGNEIAEEIFAISLMFISVYLTVISFVYFKKFSVSKLRLTDTLICIASTLLFLECCWFEIEIIINHQSMTFCQAYTIINVTVATAMRTIIYFILWLRQKSIYGGPLQHGNNIANIIGKITLSGILIFGVFQIVLISIPPQYPVQGGGCVTGPISSVIKILIPVVFSFSSAFQFVLLGLTLYPVVKQIRQGAIESSKEQLKTVAVRLCICTAICIVVDMMFLIVIRKKPDNASISYIPLCYAFNTVVNTATTLCSFANYKQRLWPFCGQNSPVETPSQANSACSAASKTVNNCQV